MNKGCQETVTAFFLFSMMYDKNVLCNAGSNIRAFIDIEIT